MKTMKNLQKIIAEQNKNHRHLLNSYEINVPTALESVFKDHIVFGVDCTKITILFQKCEDLKSNKRLYDSLKVNYERECGDLETRTPSTVVYFIIASVIDPGLKKTKKFKYVGLIDCHEDLIQFLWIHPFLRNKKIMTRFFVWYSQYENMLAVNPPLSPPCIKMMQYVQEEILENEEIIKKQAYFTKIYLKKKLGTDLVDDMTDEEVLYTRKAMESYCMMVAEDGAPFGYEKAVEIACQSAKYIFRNPGVKDQLTKWAEENVDVDLLRARKEHLIKYGYINRELKEV